jgi:hypothetical protein
MYDADDDPSWLTVRLAFERSVHCVRSSPVKQRSLMALVILIAISLVSTATAGERWSLKNLNPFKKSSASQRARASVSDQAPSRGFPRMSMPTWPTKSRSPQRPREPSTLAKLNQGTKDFLGKTKDVLTPWSKNSPSTASGSGSRSQSKKKSWFSSLLPQKKKPKEIKTVKDFLALERPEF